MPEQFAPTGSPKSLLHFAALAMPLENRCLLARELARSLPGDDLAELAEDVTELVELEKEKSRLARKLPALAGRLVPVSYTRMSDAEAKDAYGVVTTLRVHSRKFSYDVRCDCDHSDLVKTLKVYSSATFVETGMYQSNWITRIWATYDGVKSKAFMSRYDMREDYTCLDKWNESEAWSTLGPTLIQLAKDLGLAATDDVTDVHRQLVQALVPSRMSGRWCWEDRGKDARKIHFTEVALGLEKI